MAFSTQKYFFHVPFLNEIIKFECRKECVKMKSYESTIDDRSWALQNEQQSQYLSDLVNCRTAHILRDEEKSCTEKNKCTGKDVKNDNKKKQVMLGGPDGDASSRSKHNLQPDDSLIKAANNAFARLEDLLHEKSDLQSALECSKKILNKTLQERDELRARLKCFKEMEKRIADLLKKSKCVGNTQQELTQQMCKQTRCIDNMKKDLIRSENYYEQKLKNLLQNEACLRRENCKLKEEVSKYREDHKKLNCLQKHNAELFQEVQKLQKELIEYDLQYNQLMSKVSLFRNRGYSFNSEHTSSSLQCDCTS